MKKILFITHDTSRSGAPMVLLNFMKWLKNNHPEIKTSVVALKKGELLEDFKRVAARFYDMPGDTFYSRVKRKFISGKQKFSTSLVKELKKENFDLIYANTVSSIPLGVAINGARLFAHIHELPTTIKLLQPNFQKYADQVDTFIAVSKMVSEKLISDFSIPREKIKVVYEFTEKLEPKVNQSNEKFFKVGASGTFHWRKGSDVFLQVVRYVQDNYPDYNIHFTWIGKLPATEKLIAEADISKMCIQDKINFTGLVENPEDHYRELDVFLLPSREDPFPLVCIEVGMLGIPIICFENATGISEVLQKTDGLLVPYLNVEKMAQKLVHYYENPGLKIEHGRKNSVSFSQFSPEVLCPLLMNTLMGDK